MKTLFAIFSFFISVSANAQHVDLIGGNEASRVDFPASVSAQFPVPGGYGACTATIVGPQALLLAAHCISDNPKGSFTLGANRYNISCSATTRYQKGTDHDLALCKIDKAVTGVTFETVNIDQNLVKVGDVVQLTGYGCITPNRNGSGSGGNDGIYRIGEATVQTLPDSKYSYDFETLGKSALCQGDSGGPAFKYLDQNKKFRVVISANSKGNIVDTSYLASTSTPASLEFFKTWSASNGVKICGVDSSATGCRSVADTVPQDPVTPTNPICDKTVTSNATSVYLACIGGTSTDVVACDRALDTLEECRASK